MKKYACYKSACPQHNDENQGTCPTNFIAFNQVDEMKVFFRNLGKTHGRFFIFQWGWHWKITILKPLFSFFKRAWHKIRNYARDSLFHFLTSLTQDKERRSKISHACSIMMQSKVHAPQASFHLTRWMEWRFTFKLKIRLEKGVVSFLKEVDTRKELSSNPRFIF